MDRTMAIDGNTPAAGGTNSMSNPATSARIGSVAHTAHQSVDRFADRATSQIDHLSGAAHKVVNSAADAASAAVTQASGITEQAKQAQSKITESACASIRARPIAAVAGALTVGYLLGRLARF